MKNISLIGSGKVATHLGLALEDKGAIIHEVYSRNLKHAKKLSKNFYDAIPTDSLDFTKSEAEIFIIAVSDGAIEEICKQIELPKHRCILAHTSGATPMEILAQAHVLTGVFYPLQTFSFDKEVDFKKVPLCIDGTSQSVLDNLAALAMRITPKVFHINSEERKKLHLSAVFACNFTNHLLEVSSQLVKNAGLELNDLKHLIYETVDKAFAVDSPKDGQTGPAIRGDKKTILKHEKELQKDFPEFLGMYQLMTDAIMEKQGNYITADQILSMDTQSQELDNEASDNQETDELDTKPDNDDFYLSE
ncbi:DUF2520 domain-containing protein [Flammeovirga yaeyamensis]|uniref:DUF2520 domain-containing protein n=1 Tax=Flammeovirga yaeyamensis TaxID=367791 RepID=A0AAX1NA02_9BACT|nr:Rossmann-like and DUF2520 domain-containing protein [Flammeovirga yaeyamensis]MBB3699261.1 putative short-subunit dehydrogenase-like oxidoreductase (DUF2520 family) [Flammeovirga yaeyamensis]NMF35476.1 DUF2520 domain-containing protein [Flammeovirga yaeyamensis]QWG04336.1 DUF2520 domain-containing protein [Flammeovirga yaeyamensis]